MTGWKRRDGKGLDRWYAVSRDARPTIEMSRQKGRPHDGLETSGWQGS
jgi:hypothetical protein